jgi:hypothetical protein
VPNQEIAQRFLLWHQHFVAVRLFTLRAKPRNRAPIFALAPTFRSCPAVHLACQTKKQAQRFLLWHQPFVAVRLFTLRAKPRNKRSDFCFGTNRS